MADAVHYVDAPRRSPRHGGIRAVAEFRTADSRLGLGGVVSFTSPGCQMAVGKVELCYPSPMGAQATKTRAGISTLNGIAPVSGIYAGVECFLGGSDFEQDALRLLANGSDRAMETVLNTWIQAATPGTSAVGITAAIASAENQADGNYVGLPVLVLNRGDAQTAYAARALEGDGNGGLWTASGTPVLASASITAGKATVIGGVTVLEGTPAVNRVQNYMLNKEYAIAEQVFAILVDCNYIKVIPAS